MTKRLIAVTAFFIFFGHTPTIALASGFNWPSGKSGAVSFSFDDARGSELNVGLDLLRRIDLKVTFYLTTSFISMVQIEGWKQAIIDGHEIANHTVTHPCQPQSIEQMTNEVDASNRQILDVLGVRTRTFAYPCGNIWVGAEPNRQEYGPMIATKFILGRGYTDPPNISSPNDPMQMDFLNAHGTAFDEMSFESMKQIVDITERHGLWVIFVGHEIGTTGYQVTNAEALANLVSYIRRPESSLWVGTVDEIGTYVKRERETRN